MQTETSTTVFSYKFCKIKNISFLRPPPETASLNKTVYIHVTFLIQKLAVFIKRPENSIISVQYQKHTWEHFFFVKKRLQKRLTKNVARCVLFKSFLWLKVHKQPPEVFFKKGLKNFAKLTGKHLCRSLFLIKLQA